ncbi:Mitochondrial outer membrane protein porin 1 [Forsythia ovata]|uniref:Mitochondrial outer membrane protein porin 1 n=1 Tax=Forsythia ovata TaxID=205694 RepID=A0ABD1XC83_9LAMI
MIKGQALRGSQPQREEFDSWMEQLSDVYSIMGGAAWVQLAITSSGTKKGELFLADVNTQLKNKNITTDIKADTNSNVYTTITVDEPAPGVKAIFSFVVPDQKSGKIFVELQYFHEYAGITTGLGLTASPIVNFAGFAGNNKAAFGKDISFDTAIGNFTKCNAT